ncbi:MAG: RipA family octameric membrane protein [Gammaproteobacteria bacterium]
MGQPPEPESAEVRGAMEAAELPSSYFELYKLAVEMADRISARRGIANSFFLTANTGIVALLGSQDVRWYLAAAGIVFAAAWWALLKSYRDLNSAKFEIILAMEERLPIRIYGDEWDRLRREPVKFSLRRDALRSWLAQYRELGSIERIVPWVFALIYAAEIVRQLAA